MADGQKSGTNLKGVFESLVAAAIGAAGAPVFSYGWRLIADREPPDWAKGTFVNAIAAGIIFGSMFFGSRFVAKEFSRRRHATAKARGDRLAIYVAQLDGDDPSGTLRRSVIDTITNELGHDFVEVIPAGLLLKRREDLNDELAILEAESEALQLLRRKRGDVAIWGEVMRLGRRTQIAIRFVTDSSGRRGSRFGITDKLLLEPEFLRHMGSALAAVALSTIQPNSKNPIQHFHKLIGLARKLQLLQSAPTEWFLEQDRARIYEAHAAALMAIGAQLGSRRNLEEGVAAYRAAVVITPRERSPRDWARTQTKLGDALTVLGSLGGGVANLEEALVVFRYALEEQDAVDAPLDWAESQIGLAKAFEALSEHHAGTGDLEQAEKVLCAASDAISRERFPRQFAIIQMLLGKILYQIASGERSVYRLEKSATCHRAALDILKRDLDPCIWADLQHEQGDVFVELADLTGDSSHLKVAIALYRRALKGRLSLGLVPEIGSTTLALGKALITLSERTKGRSVFALSHLMEGRMLLREVVSGTKVELEIVPRHFSIAWASAQLRRAEAFRTLGSTYKDDGRIAAALMQAANAYRGCLEEYTPEKTPRKWGYAIGCFMLTMMELAARTNDLAMAKETVEQVDKAFAEAPVGNSRIAALRNVVLRAARELLDVFPGSRS